MATLPFLAPLYTPFFGDAYRAWLTLALGIGGIAALLARTGSPQATDSEVALVFPPTSGAVIVLAVLLVLQVPTSRVPYAEATLTSVLCLFWAILLMVAVATLRQRVGAQVLINHLAIAVLAGAAICAALGLLAFSGYTGSWLFPVTSSAAYGSLGQPNHFAHYLWLGIASALYLRANGRLGVVPTHALLLLILLASSLSGSRASLLYALLLFVLALWVRNAGGIRWTAWAAILYAFLLWGAPTIFVSTSALSRLQHDAAFLVAGASGEGERIRLTLLRVALDMFRDSQWLGGGLGGFRWASYASADRVEGWQGAAEHSHNLFANLLGEIGVLAPTVVFVALVLWVRRLTHRRNEVEAPWLAGMAGIALVHSLLEYPLWYPHFLGLFVAVIAIGDASTATFPFRRSFAALVVFAGIFVLFGFGYDLARLEALARPMALIETREERNARVAEIVSLRRGSLLAPQIDMAITALVPPTRETLAHRLALCRKSLAYAPSYPNAYTCALLHELDGDHRRADRLWLLAEIVFAPQREAYIKGVEAALTPEERAPLMRFLRATPLS